jgi:hypothetical protein
MAGPQGRPARASFGGEALANICEAIAGELASLTAH